VLTLESLRAEHGATPLCLLMGTDSLLAFETWHRWQEIPTLAHLVVMQRPGWTIETPPSWVEARRARGPDELRAAPAGRVWFQPVTARDISSTGIRERLGRGEPVAGLVPAAAADYIARHGLYH
jgi:nicotinate-nucleotide adenylyltransferase